MSNIGFLSYWGLDRGLAMVTLNYAKMLQGEHEVFILKQLSNEVNYPFDTVDVHITEHDEYIVPVEKFKKWITDNKLDAVVFNEYKQWTDEPFNLVVEANKLGVKTYGYLVFERFLPEQTTHYDRILSPNVSHTRFMRQHRVRNFTYIPYSIDLKEFPRPDFKRTNDKFVFFHPAGSGGVHNRKNSQKVVDAFELLDKEDTKLVITAQKNLNLDIPDGLDIELIEKNLPRKQFIEMFYKADATVIPSKWETMGIPILESLASGTPVITTDFTPMNEFVRVGTNGYLCKATPTRTQDITIFTADINVKEIKSAMANMMNLTVYPILAKNSRYVVEQIYDLKNNKKYLLDFLEKELGETNETK